MKKTLLRSFFLASLFSLSLSSQSHGQATLISQFDFTNNMVDALGNSSGAGFNNLSATYAAGSFAWIADSIPGGGVVVSVSDAALTETNYSVAIHFSFSDVSGYRKIIDFSGLQADAGFYVNDQLRLYSGGGYGPTTLTANTNYWVLFTRNGTEDTARAYLLIGNNLSLESKSEDAAQDFVPVLSGTDRMLYFFTDDSTTEDEYTPMGSVDQILIWNGVATVNDLLSSVPSLSAAQSFALYPNPANSFVNLRFPTAQNGNCEIYDATGRLVSSQALRQEDRISMSTEGLAPGIYFVRMNEFQARFVKE